MKVRDVGRFIREQRRSAEMSVRKLAELAGVSNPYLSQIERGLRRPSAEILNGIAKALRISAETLYVKAGILDDRRCPQDVLSAILADRSITERQKQVLVQVYESFRAETEGRRRSRRKGSRGRTSATTRKSAPKTTPKTGRSSAQRNGRRQAPPAAAEAMAAEAPVPGTDDGPGGRVESAG